MGVFIDSYGTVVQAGDTVLIESTYSEHWLEGKELPVIWDEKDGSYQYVDTTHKFNSPHRFAGIHSFKKVISDGTNGQTKDSD